MSSDIKTKHAPVPYEAKGIWVVLAGTNDIVAICQTKPGSDIEAKDRAESIAAACNAYDAQREMIAELVKAARKSICEPTVQNMDLRESVVKAEKLL